MSVKIILEFFTEKQRKRDQLNGHLSVVDAGEPNYLFEQMFCLSFSSGVTEKKPFRKDSEKRAEETEREREEQ